MKLLNPKNWVDKYADYMYNYTIVRVNDHEIAQDIIADTFLAALGSKKNFKGKSTERTWLISILKRKIIDYYRKINSQKGKAEVRINYRNKEQEGDWLEETVADTLSTAEENIENKELGLVILECLEKLNERQAQIFTRKTIQGVDTESVCKEFGITPSNLWVTIHRARKLMAECLEKNWYN